MSETVVQRNIRLSIGSRQGVVALRNLVAGGAIGTVIDRPSPGLVLVRGHPAVFGLGTGSADLVGWQTVVVTPEMVGKTVAIFSGWEIKDVKGKAREAQSNWIDLVNRSGGQAVIVRSPEEALRSLLNYAT